MITLTKPKKDLVALNRDFAWQGRLATERDGEADPDGNGFVSVQGWAEAGESSDRQRGFIECLVAGAAVHAHVLDRALLVDKEADAHPAADTCVT